MTADQVSLLREMQNAVETQAAASLSNGKHSQLQEHAHTQMRWALLLQERVRSVQMQVQREQLMCAKLYNENRQLRHDLHGSKPDHPLLVEAGFQPSSAAPASAVGAAACSASANAVPLALAGACCQPLAQPSEAAIAAAASPDLLTTPNLRMLSRFLDGDDHPEPPPKEETAEPLSKVQKVPPTRRSAAAPSAALGQFDALAAGGGNKR